LRKEIPRSKRKENLWGEKRETLIYPLSGRIVHGLGKKTLFTVAGKKKGGASPVTSIFKRKKFRRESKRKGKNFNLVAVTPSG